MSEEQKNTAQQSSTKKRGPNTVELEKRMEELEKGIENLTKCFEEVTTHAGWGNYLSKYKLKRYTLEANDTKRYKE